MQHNQIVFNDLIVDNLSLTADFTSTPKDISNIRSFCVQGKYTVTSDSVESILIEGSTNPDDEDMWTTITMFSLSDNSGTFMLNVELPAYTSIKVSYEKDATTDGECTIRMTGKI